MIHDSKQKDLSSNVVHALQQTQLTAQHQRKNRYIPSESMELTLEVGNCLLVEKLSYRFYPLNENALVVFKAPPQLEAQNLYDDLIKRVVGLPGDVVQIRNRERKSTYFSSVSFLSLKSGQHPSVQV